MGAGSAMSSDKATTPQTTFVQADPSNFRAIVQKLTGATDLPLTMSPSPRSNPKPSSPAPSKPGFKLHERRQRKLETIQLGRDHRQQQQHHHHQYYNPGEFCGRIPGRLSNVMVSPVSPLELFGHSSPRTPSVLSPKEEEEKAIAEKGFYLHPVSPLGTPGPPELLPLFPLHSPRDRQDDPLTSP